MIAKIINQNNLIKIYIIKSFYYDIINSEDYLILNIEDGGVERIRVDDINTFQLSKK